MSPVCPWKSSWTAYKLCAHHFTTEMSPTLKVIFSSLFPLIYFNRRFNSPQSSLFCLFTRVMRNDKEVCMNHRYLVLMNRSCDTVWWKFCAWSSGSYCVSLSLCMLKRWSATRVSVVVPKFSGNYVAHYLSILPWIPSLLLVWGSWVPFPISYVPFPYALWVFHICLAYILKTWWFKIYPHVTPLSFPRAILLSYVFCLLSFL